MPIYPVKNLKTGEEKELHLSIQGYADWREANPEWDKDWSKGVARTSKYSRSALNADAICSDTMPFHTDPDKENPNNPLFRKAKDEGKQIQAEMRSKGIKGKAVMGMN
tara:strand:- start:298 stop:621 length:324 start_codon:yes stop_codon:yes gene_type:complete